MTRDIPFLVEGFPLSPLQRESMEYSFNCQKYVATTLGEKCGSSRVHRTSTYLRHHCNIISTKLRCRSFVAKTSQFVVDSS